MVLLTDIADDLVEALNAHEFAQDFLAERLYRPNLELETMDELHVTVVMQSLAMETITKDDATRDDIKIGIWVQKKLSKVEEDGEVDDLMALVKEIVEHIESLGEFGGATLTDTENSTIYSEEHLKTLRQFTSVVTLSLTAM